MKPVLVIGGAAAPGEDSPWETGSTVQSWAKIVHAFLETPFEHILHEMKDGNVLHFDMSVYPERGDALDHFDKASVVIADHLFFCYYEPQRSFFYNRRNNQILAVAAAHEVPVFVFGDYPSGGRLPDSQATGWRLYLPENP